MAFGGIGLLLAGMLRAEVNLAAANGLYLVLLLLGGMVVPLAKLPAGLADVAKLLPAAALSDGLHAALGTGSAVPVEAWVVLGRLGGRRAGRGRAHVPLGVTRAAPTSCPPAQPSLRAAQPPVRSRRCHVANCAALVIAP